MSTVIFVLFSIAVQNRPTMAESWLNSWRVQSEKKMNDTLAAMGKTGEFEDFRALLDEIYVERNARLTVYGENVADNTRAVRNFLQNMDITYMAVSFVYFAQYAIEYYTLTGRFASDLIGSKTDHGFCVLAAWYDRRAIVDDELECLLCGQFLVGTAAATNDADLFQIGELSAYKDQYEMSIRLSKHSHVGSSPNSPVFERQAENATRLREVENVIVNFSDAFCSRWRPLVGTFLLTKRPALDCRKHLKSSTRFIRHVFEKETCEVHLDSEDTTWKCDRILRSQEYGFGKYVEDVAKTIRREVSHQPTAENTDEEFLFSLTELRKKTNEEYNDNYQNAVTYYNVASDVVLFVSIREGSKILKGIRHVVTRDCKNNNGLLSVDEILGLRSTLSTFKSVFDRLVALMLDEKGIDVTDDPDKKTFDGQVNSLVKLLDIGRDQRTDNATSIRKMCAEVPNILQNGENYEAHFGENAYKNIKFVEFYFTLPILYTNQLYRFYAYDFA